MKARKTIAIILGLSLVAPVAMAEHHYRHGGNRAFAKVIEVTPVYETARVPKRQQRCWDEVVEYRSHRNDPGAVLAGAVIGSVIGHELGNGRGGATAAGAIMGAAIGGSGRRHQVAERRCKRVTRYITKRRVIGYDVAYRYFGRMYHTRMDYDPGRRIRVDVQVTPMR